MIDRYWSPVQQFIAKQVAIVARTSPPRLFARLRIAPEIVDSIPADYTVILTADHGGHGRGHGSDDPQDMTIPIVCRGPRFEKGREYPGGSIKDIAPTVAKLLEVAPAKEWEGKPLV